MALRSLKSKLSILFFSTVIVVVALVTTVYLHRSNNDSKFIVELSCKGVENCNSEFFNFMAAIQQAQGWKDVWFDHVEFKNDKMFVTFEHKRR